LIATWSFEKKSFQRRTQSTNPQILRDGEGGTSSGKKRSNGSANFLRFKGKEGGSLLLEVKRKRTGGDWEGEKT